MKKQIAGFTLIELLVVILIIGILAAVAVPQYQKAMYKSRTTEALTMLSQIYKALQVYQLANGTVPQSLSQLDVDIPQNRIKTSWIASDANDSLHYYFSYNNGQIAANAADPNLPLFTVNTEHKFYCIRWGGKTSLAENLCKDIGTYEEETSDTQHTPYYLL